MNPTITKNHSCSHVWQLWNCLLFQLCVTPVSWWKAVFDWTEKQMYFFSGFYGAKLPSKFCPKMTCFRSCCLMGILEPRIFLHAQKYRKLLLRTWHPPKVGQVRRRYLSCSKIHLKFFVYGWPPTFTTSVLITWKLDTHRKKGKCCMDCFIEMSVFKNLGNDQFLYRDNIVSCTEISKRPVKWNIEFWRLRLARPEQRMHFKSQGHFRCSARIEVISRFLEELISFCCLKPGINVRTGVSFCKGTLFYPLTSFDFFQLWNM